MSLVEVLVAMSLLAALGTMVVKLVVSVLRQSAATQLRQSDLDQARIAMDALTRMMRTAVEPAQLQTGCASCTGPASTATALTDATATKVQFFANTGAASGPLLVTYAVENFGGAAKLSETVQPPDAGSAPNYRYTLCTPGPGCAIRRRVLVRNLLWPLPSAVLAYYDNAGGVLAPGSFGLTPQQLIAVDSIDVTLPVRTANGYGVGPMTVTNRISLPNASSGVLPTPSPTG